MSGIDVWMSVIDVLMSGIDDWMSGKDVLMSGIDDWISVIDVLMSGIDDWMSGIDVAHVILCLLSCSNGYRMSKKDTVVPYYYRKLNKRR